MLMVQNTQYYKEINFPSLFYRSHAIQSNTQVDFFLHMYDKYYKIYMKNAKDPGIIKMPLKENKIGRITLT